MIVNGHKGSEVLEQLELLQADKSYIEEVKREQEKNKIEIHWVFLERIKKLWDFWDQWKKSEQGYLDGWDWVSIKMILDYLELKLTREEFIFYRKIEFEVLKQQKIKIEQWQKTLKRN